MRASVACCLFAILFTAGRAPVATAAAGSEQWVQLVPPAVAGLHVRDTKRDREIFFDEQGLLAVPDHPTIEWQRIWSGVNPMSSASSGFAFYDPLRDRVWVMARTLRDSVWVWSMDLSSPSPDWVLNPFVWKGPAIGSNTSISNFASAFDPARDRVLTFGGYVIISGCFLCSDATNAIYSVTLGDTATVAAETIEGIAPPGVGAAAMTYDPWRDRMIMFGGVSYGPILYDRTWALSLGTPMHWTEMTPMRLPPQGRLTIAISQLDSVGQRWVMDGWALDLSSAVAADVADWRPVPSDLAVPVPSSVGPAAWFEQPRQSRLMIYDGTSLLSISSHSTPAWSLVTEIGRVKRSKPIAFVDALHQRLYAGFGLVAGDVDGTLQARRLDRDQPWTPVASPEIGPTPRHGAVGVVDAVSRRALVFGGGSRSGADQYSDLWSYNLDDGGWSLLTSGDPPIKRMEALGVFDAAHRRLIVHGGRYRNPSPVALGDTWIFDVSAGTWSSPPTGTYGDRWGEIGIYDPLRDRVISMGSSDRTRQVHALSLSPSVGQWTALATLGNSPSLSSDTHAAAYDPIGDRIIVVGEQPHVIGDRNFTTGVWALTLSDPPTWSELSPLGTPPAPRYGAQLVSDPERGRMLLVGGTTYENGPEAGDDWVLYLHDLPAGILLSAAPSSGEVTLRWRTSESGASATIERRDDGADWQELGRQDPDESGVISWIDRAILPGSRYDYRVRIFSPRGERMFGETHVEVPLAPVRFALEGMWPNPAVGPLMLAFSLAVGGRTTFDMVDVTGRSVLHRDFEYLPAGRQTIRLDEGAPPAPGLYFVQMHHGGQVLSRKAVVVK